MKLVWLSDLHFVAQGEVLGHDPRRRLEAAIDYIVDHVADADLCVISGDMVNDPDAGDYAAVATGAEASADADLPDGWQS